MNSESRDWFKIAFVLGLRCAAEMAKREQKGYVAYLMIEQEIARLEGKFADLFPWSIPANPGHGTGTECGGR